MPTGPGRSTRHLATWAGDLAWQHRPDAPPACRTPTDLPREFEQDWHRLFDAPGELRISAKEWERIRAAIGICRSRCPVRAECLNYALEPSHRSEGVWGGYYFPPSSAVLDGRRVPQVPPPPGKRGRGRAAPAVPA